jgi:hypothetical protein
MHKYYRVTTYKFSPTTASYRTVLKSAACMALPINAPDDVRFFFKSFEAKK